MIQKNTETAPEITRETTMGQILSLYPEAQKVLFFKYHIGGCGNCGYQPSETLEQVCKRRSILGVNEVIRTVKESAPWLTKLEAAPSEVAELLKTSQEVKLLDVREPWEHDAAKIAGSKLLNQELSEEIMGTWPKETPLIFYCHHGVRSLDAATYFAGHGFVASRSLTGGIDRWSQEIDSTVPRY